MTPSEPVQLPRSGAEKRRGFTVALIGPDGAGKTSVAGRLAHVLPLPVTYLYMGVNPGSSNVLLPTTRLVHAARRARGIAPDTAGPRDSRRPDRAPPKGRVKRTLRSGRSFLRLANRLAEEWQRALVASLQTRRGSIVVFDRHFFADYYAYDVAAPRRRSASRRLHGYVLARLYPKPDLVVYLDAPAETLLLRKGEGTLESLARRRREYLDLGGVMRNFVVVDADRPLDDVVREVAALVEAFASGERLPHAAANGTSGRPRSRQETVLVTDAARGSAVSVIRSLGRRGMRVIAAGSEGRSPGFSSRYAAERLRYPSPHESPEEMVETLLAAARERGVDLIVPVTDETLLPLASARERFAGVCKLALPEPEALATSRDKMATLELASELGIPVPRTELVSTANEARRAGPALGWPLVLKPRFSRIVRDGRLERYEVTYAEDEDALAEQMAPLEGRCEVMLQEYCAGEGHGVELLAHEGRMLAAFQHRRLREVPITGGASSFRESVAVDPLLFDYSARLLAALDWTGLAMVEFKVGEDGPSLMEVNGRIWGSLPLAVKSGMDFPARLADVCLGRVPAGNGPPDSSYAVGVRSRNLDLEVVWIGSTLRRARRHPAVPVPRRSEAVGAALRLFYPPDGFDVLTREDPRPGLVELARIGGKLRRKVARGR
jgi:predicted ATP-grasp superfamily ATP-dependent carboligase/thymidylate kinase